MNIKDAKQLIIDNYKQVKFLAGYTTDIQDKPYKANNLIQLREALINLENVEMISSEISELKDSALFSSNKDEVYFNSSDRNLIDRNVQRINIGLEFLLNYENRTSLSGVGLDIKLPEIQNFDDLSKVSLDFKKAIELPILDIGNGSYVKIESAESGSIWLKIGVGTIMAVNLIAAICWAAAVIRKKKAEAKIFEEHARTLELKNDALGEIVNAQNQQLKNIIESEAKSIQENNYDSNDPEVLARLKLSIATVSDLIDRGTQILPASDNKDVIKMFPDYSNLNLIESKTKKLME
ncbi:hypothetical protein [Flavobacterium pallidum]|uniref:Uncharacterized protein n=1 Tax=Flavobacterium pallidum TaxID=2172098 RepID=A0A2S1SK67_9FLAO|nr:hypothetical protein [Flavobacterium pallidum]AWI26823.1 hypothetical protein HYN49_13460 [Flavobacterium pallidum]